MKYQQFIVSRILHRSTILQIAASNLLMCAFRFNDDLVWNLLTGHSKDKAASGMHAAIVMAGRIAQPA